MKGEADAGKVSPEPPENPPDEDRLTAGDGMGPEGGEKEAVGPFSSWASLYGVAVAYGIGVILLLILLTSLLDFGGSP